MKVNSASVVKAGESTMLDARVTAEELHFEYWLTLMGWFWPFWKLKDCYWHIGKKRWKIRVSPKWIEPYSYDADMGGYNHSIAKYQRSKRP